MVIRIALIFVGFILTGVFLNLYYLAFTMVAIVALGVENRLALETAYWVCLFAGIATTFYVLRNAWPRESGAKRPKSEDPKFD